MNIFISLLLKIARRFKRPNSFHNKIMAGYQGWFGCPNDGSELNSWFHWESENLPDVSELSQEELFTRGSAKVYSSYNKSSVTRHFKWMHEYSIDGIFLQRFVCELSSGPHLEFRNKVLSNVREAAEQYGRVFSVMYDISGEDNGTLYERITSDWESIKTVTNSNMYTKFNNKPLVTVWGFGFKENNCTPEVAMNIIQYFKDRECAVMGGVPAYYRSLDRDCKSDPAWKKVFRMLDVISPWTVGRYTDDKSASKYQNFTLAIDTILAWWRGQDYMPVVFPGYSFPNKPTIPSRGGQFLLHQVKNLCCTSLYIAMFDEVNEGTAVYKLADTSPSDLYLKLIARMKNSLL